MLLRKRSSKYFVKNNYQIDNVHEIITKYNAKIHMPEKNATQLSLFQKVRVMPT